MTEERKITQRELREIANLLAQVYESSTNSNVKAVQAFNDRAPVLVPKLVNWIYRVLSEVEQKHKNVN